jgi:hypothetical protein
MMAKGLMTILGSPEQKVKCSGETKLSQTSKLRKNNLNFNKINEFVRPARLGMKPAITKANRA